MGCESCSSKSGGVPGGCRNNGLCSTGGCNKLEVFDWLSNIQMPDAQPQFDIVEVRFKNSRKGFFRNVHNIPLYTGDAVAVESSPGFDVGVVTITGELVRLQMNKKEIGADSAEIRKVYRKAKAEDLDKWKEARGLENETMHRARKMALNLGLEMKISDVEYQGDRTKATFYYTAEGRVDFRELIKVMADEFKIRIEMRQIGARQEASRLGGIGSCGRELCCSTWLTDFRTVSTSAARYQQLSLNPQKLAGQCGKLKCCLNYELDMYVEAYKEFPDNNIRLQTKKGSAVHMKTDIFRRMMWYSVHGEIGNTFVGLKIDRVKEIIEQNKKGIEVEDLMGYVEQVIVEKQPDFDNVVGQDSLTRFDEKREKKGLIMWSDRIH
jgi:cell fate regulator YaaT (PSP1 superfamily)